MTPTISAFERSHDSGKGLARDMRVRRALEEERARDPVTPDDACARGIGGGVHLAHVGKRWKTSPGVAEPSK